MTGRFEFDLLAHARFPFKVAIGIGHWLWGDSWSRGADADSLRRGLWCTTEAEMETVAQEFLWTNIEPTVFRMRIEDGEHGFVIARGPDNSTLIGIFLFGHAGWIVRVGESPTVDPMLLLLDVRTRALRKLIGVEIARAKRIDFGAVR